MTDGIITAGQSRYTSQNTVVTGIVFYNPTEDLQITDPDFISAYWMGWVSWDDLPYTAHLSQYAIDDDTITFSDVTRRENVDITYMTPVSTQLTPGYWYNNYEKYDEDEGYWREWDANTNFIPSGSRRYCRLYNKLDVNINLINTFSLQFAASIYIRDRSTWSECTLTASVGVKDLISGTFSADATVDLRSGYNPELSSVTITQGDITGHVVERSTDTHIIRMCLQHVGVGGFFRSITTAGAMGSYFCPRPVFRIHDLDDHAYLVGMTSDGTAYPQISWRNGAAVVVNAAGAITTQYQNPYYMWDAPADTPRAVISGGFVGSLTLNQIAAVKPDHEIMEINGANFAIIGTGGRDYVRIVRMLDMSDVMSILGFQCRAGLGDGSTEDDNTYVTDGTKYYPLVVDGRFMGTLVSGAERDRLQPWQIAGEAVDPTTNTYTESEKPIYIPPDPDDRDKIGDSIGFRFSFPASAATGLYTMYALRAAHMGQLGAKLWSSIGDSTTNFWQNLQMAIGAYSETGSADISQILEYFNSLRVYPFALASLPGFSGAGSGAIRVGTGKTALDLSGGGAGNVGIMGDFTGIIDAGAVVVPYHYDDFRDIDGVTVSVYLPYIGTQTLNAADVLGCTLSLTYAIDLTTGSCVAYLLCSGGGVYYPIGIYSGTIGADIPLTATQGNRLFTRQLSSAIGDIASLVSGKLIPDSVGGGISAISKMQSAANALTSGGLTPPSLGGGGANFAGFGAPQTAYLQIRRHKYAYTGRTFPASQLGRRTSGVQYLGALSGYTVCENVDVSGIPAPADVQRDIKNMLESGVYL